VAVNASSLESWDDEFPLAGLTKAPSRVVKPPRVAESPVQFECKTHSIVRVQGDSLVGHSDIVIGRVVAIHVKGEYITADGVRMSYHLIRAITDWQSFLTFLRQLLWPVWVTINTLP
jgi:flavin reductase (DIM6/NTAB) family NADH-FMN oxidoreductase RutF